MGRKQEQKKERMVLVTIRPPEGEPIQYETWQYHSILNKLREEHATMNESYDTTKWICRKAKPGDKKEIWPGITVEVTEG